MAEFKPDRRRALGLLAAAGACLGVGGPQAGLGLQRWHGPVLGGEGRISAAGLDRQDVRRAVTLALGEIARLENCFSLFDAGSELSRLNRDGLLRAPSHDFQVLLSRAIDCWQRTDGAFNPAVQPVWAFLDRHFRTAPDREPDRRRLRDIARACDPRRIAIGGGGIALAPGMALTLNGIAQGYITDTVTGLLAAHGFDSILIELGEMRALPGRDWPVALTGGGRVDLSGRALATSAARGTAFTPDGRWHHLIDPDSGLTPSRVASVSVIADDATTADALATALAVAEPARHRGILARFPGATAVIGRVGQGPAGPVTGEPA